MDAERMLGSLLRSGVSRGLGGSGGALGRLAGGGLGSLAGGGLNNITRGLGGGGGLGGLGRMGAVGLIGGIAVAAADHFLEKRNQTGQAAGRPASGHTPPPSMPGHTPPPPMPHSPAPGMTHTAGTPPPPPPGAPPPVTGNAPPPPPGAAAGPSSAPPPPAQSGAIDPMLLIRAMVAAAAADGTVDDSERARLLDAVKADDGDAEDVATLEALLADPPSLDRIVADTPVQAAPTVYTAAVMAIDIDTPAERYWLQALAARLGLDPNFVAEIHADAGAPPP